MKFNLSRVKRDDNEYFKIDNTWMTFDTAE